VGDNASRQGARKAEQHEVRGRYLLFIALLAQLIFYFRARGLFDGSVPILSAALETLPVSVWRKKNEQTKSAKLHFCRCSSHAHILYDGKPHFFPFSREKKRDNFQPRKLNTFLLCESGTDFTIINWLEFAGKMTKLLSFLFWLKMDERTEAKSAKRIFASECFEFLFLTRSFASRFQLRYVKVF